MSQQIIQSREVALEKIFKLASQLEKEFSIEKYDLMWEIANNYNQEHNWENEIFMCEIDTWDDKEVFGNCIEDHTFIFNR